MTTARRRRSAAIGARLQELRFEDASQTLDRYVGKLRQTGVVFHMMAALAEEGWIGMTAVGDTAEDADRIYDGAIAVLDEEAAAT